MCMLVDARSEKEKRKDMLVVLFETGRDSIFIGSKML